MRGTIQRTEYDMRLQMLRRKMSAFVLDLMTEEDATTEEVMYVLSLELASSAKYIVPEPRKKRKKGEG